MISKLSMLTVADNSGAWVVKCIQVYKKKFAKVGDIIKVSIISKSPHKKIIKNKIYLALIITSKLLHTRLNGIYIVFNKSRVIMLSDQLKFLGTRYRGLVSKEIYKYKKKILKIVSLAKFIL